jgi:hypothetical protein
VSPAPASVTGGRSTTASISSAHLLGADQPGGNLPQNHPVLHSSVPAQGDLSVPALAARPAPGDAPGGQLASRRASRGRPLGSVKLRRNGRAFAPELVRYLATAKKSQDLDVLSAFNDYPAEHWIRLHTTNRISPPPSCGRGRGHQRGRAPRAAGVTTAGLWHGCPFQVSNCSRCTRSCTFCSMSLTVASKRSCARPLSARALASSSPISGTSVSLGLRQATPSWRSSVPALVRRTATARVRSPSSERNISMCHVVARSIVAPYTCGDVTHGAWERRQRPEAEDPPAWVERPLRLSIGLGFDPVCPDALWDLGHVVSASSGPKRLRRTREMLKRPRASASHIERKS